MQENIQSGLLTELACQLDFTKYGILLYAPIISDSRCDFIAEIKDSFIRIQCKSATESEDGNSFSFSTVSKNWNTKEKKTYKDQIDYFYTNHKGQGYLVPIDKTGVSAKTLRLFSLDDKNPAIVWAKDYRIEKVLKEIDDTLVEFIPHKRKSPRKTSNCIDCNIEITYGSTRCKSCREKFVKKEIPISREELKEMIRKDSFLSIGKKFNVSDNAIRKWCDKYNLPRLKSEIKKYSDEEWSKI